MTCNRNGLPSDPQHERNHQRMTPETGCNHARQQASGEQNATSTVSSGMGIDSAGTILFVDDERMITDVVCHMLKRLGYGVIVANSGQEALEKYRIHGSVIGLVILDVVMPEMDGCETFHRLRRLDPEVKVLLCSGFSPDGRAEDALSCGCLGFIRKPLSMDKLSAQVGAFCQANA